MIGAGAYRASLNDAERLFRDMGLLETVGTFVPREDLTRRARSTGSYRDEWELFVSEQAYSFALSDYSIVQMHHDPENDREIVGYCYFQCPLVVRLTESAFRDEYDDPLAELDYEEYVFSSDARLSPVYLRYDYSPALYTEVTHPSGHLHVGHRTDVRVAVRRFWTPFAFACFVGRQVYPESWRRHVASCDQAARTRLTRGLRDDLLMTPDEHWRPGDAIQHCLW